jgi:hypothetical protein
LTKKARPKPLDGDRARETPKKNPPGGGWGNKAGEGVRTLDIDVGNVTLYQLSYAREAKKQPDFTK